MPSSALKPNSLSPQDYLAGEETSPQRYEYVDGAVYAMAGESKVHNTIALNIAVFLRTALRGSACRVFMENVKTQVKTAHTECYYYPDIQVSCGSGDSRSHYESQPKLIVEVLSNSTERRDRADKFFAYRQLDSLQEYVLVAQDTQRVEIYRRDSHWEWTLYTETDRPIPLDSLGLTLNLGIVYEDTEVPVTVQTDDSDEV